MVCLECEQDPCACTARLPFRKPYVPQAPGPEYLTLDEGGREKFDAIKKAAGQRLRADWTINGITDKLPAPLPSGWVTAGQPMRQWADKWFPPLP